ncbi:MAG: hypothetical protein H7835_19935 [Magnetococcus sp. XQGC-1]
MEAASSLVELSRGANIGDPVSGGVLAGSSRQPPAEGDAEAPSQIGAEADQNLNPPVGEDFDIYEGIDGPLDDRLLEDTPEESLDQSEGVGGTPVIEVPPESSLLHYEGEPADPVVSPTESSDPASDQAIVVSQQPGAPSTHASGAQQQDQPWQEVGLFQEGDPEMLDYEPEIPEEVSSDEELEGESSGVISDPEAIPQIIATRGVTWEMSPGPMIPESDTEEESAASEAGKTGQVSSPLIKSKIVGCFLNM